MEIMENINYKQYLDKIEQYEKDIKLLEDEEAQLIKEVKDIENLETTSIQERKEKSKQLIEKRSELEVTSEALQSLKNEFEQYCKTNADEVRSHIQYNKVKKRKVIDKEIKDFAKKLFVKIKKETEEQIKLKNEVDVIYSELVKISEYGKTSFLPSISIFGTEYSDLYTEDIFISELKRLALE